MATRWLQTIFLTLSIAILLGGSFPLPQAMATSLQPTCPEGMAWIEGGTFRMGSDDFFPEERAVENVTVDSFCIDRTEVTNAQFAEFVKATHYITVAERPLSKEQFPDLPDEMRLPGSLVFQMPEPGVKQVGYLSWWHWTSGASWQHPFGPDSDIEGKENYPVVHIAYEDAEAYANWAGKQLPTEAQWEFAARGGLKNAIFSWGNKYSAKKANTWQGSFPFLNTQKDGYLGTAPVASFPSNGYGLYDMTGNVWEWTSDWYRVGHQGLENKTNPQGPKEQESFDPNKPDGSKHVVKGGSYLCAKNYCSRYRPAARESQDADTGTTHIGFRLVTTK
ncbi:MAG: formylglycine-generating enzyme family protein [Cyanobacteria bacterium SID2]|nr:formylglycine-generating enzyme family protein [Cyanobacteria bacterium SID2]